MTHHLQEIVWEILDKSYYTKLPTLLLPNTLPNTEAPLPVALILREEKRLYAMTPPPLEKSHFPAAIISTDLLHQYEIWKEILKIYPLSISDLSHYWKCHLEPRKIEPFPLLKACGRKTHFQSLEEWNELSVLSLTGRNLANTYRLPLRILRLWERLSKMEQSFWLEIWNEYLFGKNLIQEIICIFYELNHEQRKQAIALVRELGTRWKKESVKTPPVDCVLEELRQIRFPQIYSFKKDLYARKKRLEQKLKGKIHLEFPQAMEAESLSMSLNFSNLEELKECLALLSDKSIQESLGELFDVL